MPRQPSPHLPSPLATHRPAGQLPTWPTPRGPTVADSWSAKVGKGWSKVRATVDARESSGIQRAQWGLIGLGREKGVGTGGQGGPNRTDCPLGSHLVSTTSLMWGKPSGFCMLAKINWKPSRKSRS